MDSSNSMAEHLLGERDVVSSCTEKESENRIDLMVSPSDSKWAQMHDEFDKLLRSDWTINQILSTYFPASQIRLFSRSDCPELKQIQDDNTERYKRLLRGRFAGVSTELTTKLTMMYFGLPVAPMEFDIATFLEKWERREPEDPRFNVKPPLHFLTAHKDRNWGDESLRGREDDVGPLPVPIPKGPILRLRGGDGDSDAANDDFDLEDLDVDGASDSDFSEMEQVVDESIDYVPDTEPSVRHVDADPAGWIDLFGFQGIAPFVPGNWSTYATAVRRLLSVPPAGDEQFDLVHYDKKKVRVVNEIIDSLPLTPQSPSMEYISKRFDSRWQLHYDDSVFFVKLRGESPPPGWQPDIGQALGLDTIRIRCALPEAPDPRNPPVSYSYLPRKSLDQAKALSKNAHVWDANQYTLYFRNALEVLLGPSDLDSFHHGYQQIFIRSKGPSGLPFIYGLANISPSHLQPMLDPSTGNIVELEDSTLGNDEISFILPGYFPTGNDNLMTTAKRSDSKATFSSDEEFPTAAKIVRYMVRSFLGKEADSIQHVRLLAACFILCPAAIFDQPYCSIPMSNDIRQVSDEPVEKTLNQLIKHKSPMVMLLPEWKASDTLLYGGWTGKSPGEAVGLPIPPLSSSVDDFRKCVSELLDLTKDEPDSPPLDVAISKRYISIQPVQESSDVKTASSNNVIDLPCFHIGPHTTDAEWYNIRARIPTRAAVVHILSEKDHRDWVTQVDQATWGPRYGEVARLFKEKSKKPRAKVVRIAEDTKVDALPNPLKEARPEEGNGQAFVTTVSHPVKSDTRTNGPLIEGLDHVARSRQVLQRGFNPKEAPIDPDDRRRTWASQPSIFDGFNFRTWPANSGIQIPKTAPPMEQILRISHNVPMVTKSVLTPTEQGELQRRFWELRNLILGRVSKCSFADCHFTYKHGEDDALAAHLQSMHLARKCIWCDDFLYDHWTEEKRLVHLRQKHRDQLMEALGVCGGAIIDHDGGGTISIPLKRVWRHHIGQGLAMVPAAKNVAPPVLPRPKPAVDEFCGCCGRNRGQFLNGAERDYHDRNCRSGIYNGAKCTFCRACGGHFWLTATDAQQSKMSDGPQQTCKHDRNDPAGHYCQQCGFDVGTLAPEDQQRHNGNCKGFGSVFGRFCLYCGIAFPDDDAENRLKANIEHMRQCYSQVIAGSRPGGDEALPTGVKTSTTAGQGNRFRGRQITRLRMGDVEKADFAAERRKRDPQQALESENQESWETREIQVRKKANGKTTAGTQTTTRRPLAAMRRPIKIQVAISESSEDEDTRASAEPNDEGRGRKRSRDGDEPFAEEEASLSETKGKRTVKRDKDVDEPEEVEDTTAVTPKNTAKDSPRRRAKRKRGVDGDEEDGEYEFEDEEDVDEEEGVSETDSDAEQPDAVGNKVKKPKGPRRRAESPDWNEILGPEDPTFEPKGDHHCSKCLRKFPVKPHKRERSPLGLKKEKELHMDKKRCCRIRNGIGSTDNLPNRSGWIPSSKMPKPISALRDGFLRRYPAYARTVYPLNPRFVCGSFWRADPNNDDNDKWWDMPWPAFPKRPPFPGWDAPDAPEDDGQSARKRQEFRLKAVPDPTYRYQSDEDVDDQDTAGLVPDDAEDSPSRSKKRRGRPRKTPVKKGPEVPVANGATDAAPKKTPGAKKSPKVPVANGTTDAAAEVVTADQQDGAAKTPRKPGRKPGSATKRQKTA